MFFHLVLSLLSSLLRSLGLLSGKLHRLGNSTLTEASAEVTRKGLKVALAPGASGPSSVGLDAPVVYEKEKKECKE